MNILVTGATSFIGANVIKQLLKERGNVIYAICRPNSQNINDVPKDENVKIVELDLKEIENLHRCIDVSIDVFFHFAWEGARLPYRDDDEIQNKNYIAAVKAIKECYKLGCRKFIASGSQAEYGLMSGEITEEYVCKPVNAYGKAKYKAYLESFEFAKEYGIELIWGRVFSIYGTGDYEGTLIMYCLKKMQKNEEIMLTQCIQDWDYLYIDEVAEIFGKFAKISCKSGCYNIASGVHMPLRDYVEIIKEETRTKSVIRYGAIAYPESGMVSFRPDIRKMQNAIEWHTKITFREAINKMIAREEYV